MEEWLLDSWAIHSRINLYLLDAVPPEALLAVSASKGRTVGEQFAHVHNVRVLWLRQAAPDLSDGVGKVEKDQATGHATLRAALESSSPAIADVLRRGLASGGKVKGFKPHVVAFLSYLVSHESHHRGQIALTLKQSGHPLDKKVAYGMWEWGVR